MRVVLYGFGKNLKKQYNNLIEFDLVCIADKRVDEILPIEKERFICPFIAPEDIKEYEYDYVVITSVAMFESIKQQLICENGIDSLKIVSIQLLLKINNSNRDEFEEKRIFELFGSETEIFYDIISEIKYIKKITQNGYKRYTTAFFDFYQKKWDEPRLVDGLNIYVVTHKDYCFPGFPSYIPVSVGGYKKEGVLDDYCGTSISSLNSKINEMTAIYWVWKNRMSDIVGFCHYRRFFCDNEIACFENVLKPQTVKEYLKDVEIIVNEQFFEEHSNYDILKMPLSIDAVDTGYYLIEKSIKEYQQEYLEDFYDVMNGHNLCYYNMFITTWELFDEYCSWLFSFLLPAAEEFDADNYEGQDKRTIGFFAERMLSVWLHHNPKKLKSLPVYVP